MASVSFFQTMSVKTMRNEQLLFLNRNLPSQDRVQLVSSSFVNLYMWIDSRQDGYQGAQGDQRPVYFFSTILATGYTTKVNTADI